MTIHTIFDESTPGADLHSYSKATLEVVLTCTSLELLVGKSRGPQTSGLNVVEQIAGILL